MFIIEVKKALNNKDFIMGRFVQILVDYAPWICYTMYYSRENGEAPYVKIFCSSACITYLKIICFITRIIRFLDIREES